MDDYEPAPYMTPTEISEILHGPIEEIRKALGLEEKREGKEK